MPSRKGNMTGPEHYAEAERLLALAPSDGDPRSAQIVAEAQVHATLALAAATALGSVDPQATSTYTGAEWRRTIFPVVTEDD